MTLLERVYSAQWKRFSQGELIQRAFPGLTAEQREFIQSNTTPAEWKKIFGRVTPE